MKICLEKMGTFFQPTDKSQFELMAQIPSGKEFIVDINLNRNPANHRRYFAFINMAFDMQETFDNKENLRHYLQMRAGHYDTYITHKGKTMYQPRSISWEKLGELEFKQLFSECINAFLAFYAETHEVPLSEDEFMKILYFA